MRARFGEFVLDSDARSLERGGAPLPLTRKSFELLALLVSERPRVVPKEELLARVWPDAIVTADNLKNLVAKIRKALGRQGAFVRTVNGVGYAFAGTVVEESGPASAARGWLYFETRALAIAEGETILGRSDDCGIRIDSPGVSRHHARLAVGPDGVSIEDLGSKNGTLVGRTRVRQPVALRDGDRIRLGSARLTYRARSADRSTVTERSEGSAEWTRR